MTEPTLPRDDEPLEWDETYVGRDDGPEQEQPEFDPSLFDADAND